MKTSIQPETHSPATTAAPQMNGACVVDEHGNETPITEQMVCKALSELERAWDQVHCKFFVTKHCD